MLLKIAPLPKVANVNGASPESAAEIVELLATPNEPVTTLVTSIEVPPWLK